MCGKGKENKMDTGSGNINYLNKFEVAGVTGKLVSWEIGEEVEVKGCRFKVKNIKVFPDNEILLIGKPKRGFSQEGLARKVNITSSAFCQIEKGKINPSMDTFLKLLKELGMRLVIEEAK